MNLGVVLRKYRMSREISLRHLAKEIGINYQLLARLEGGHGLDAEPLVQILVWLTSKGSK